MAHVEVKGDRLGCNLQARPPYLPACLPACLPVITRECTCAADDDAWQRQPWVRSHQASTCLLMTLHRAVCLGLQMAFCKWQGGRNRHGSPLSVVAAEVVQQMGVESLPADPLGFGGSRDIPGGCLGVRGCGDVDACGRTCVTSPGATGAGARNSQCCSRKAG